jgi:hypothetical protein
LQTRRAAVTLVAIASDDQQVQQKVPQVLVVNEHTLTKADLADISGRCGHGVVILRRKSSWVNSALMLEVLQLLAASLQVELKERFVVLHMDTYSAHTHQTVLEACSALRMHIHFIPACTTSWLQPLDVAVFAKFKMWVEREAERQHLASSSHGPLSRPQMLEIWIRGVGEVIRKHGWHRAFSLCGLQGQDHLSTRLLARLELSSPPHVGNQLPCLADLQAVFPAGTDIPVEAIFRMLLPKPAVAPPRMLVLHPRARLPKVAVHMSS